MIDEKDFFYINKKFKKNKQRVIEKMHEYDQSVLSKDALTLNDYHGCPTSQVDKNSY